MFHDEYSGRTKYSIVENVRARAAHCRLIPVLGCARAVQVEGDVINDDLLGEDIFLEAMAWFVNVRE